MPHLTRPSIPATRRSSRAVCAAALAAVTAIGVSVMPGAGATAPSPTAAAPATSSDAPRWATSGRWITDEQGRVVITQGINEVSKFAPYTHDALGFDDDDAAFLAQQGFTSVRLGVIWKAVEPRPGQYDDAYLASIKRTVETLNRHGVATLLDFHQDMFNEAFQGEGAPDWAVQTGGAPNVIKAGFPGNYMLNTATMNAFQAFVDNKPGPDGVGLADHYANAWAHTASFVRSTPGVMGFDVWNEPFPGNLWTGCLSPLGCPVQDARVSRVEQKAVDAIRRVDEATTIYYEPIQFFNVGIPTHTTVTAHNVAFSFHDYCLGQSVFKKYVGCSVPDRNVFDNAEKQATKYGQATLLTEFGATTAADVITAQVDLAMKNRVGFQWWAYTGSDPTTAGPGNVQAVVFDPHEAPQGDNVDWAKLRLMAVPQPNRVAGTPGAYTYDRSAGVLHFSYTPTKVSGGTFDAGSTTTITVPEVAMPNGYTVTAHGATVTSAPDARTVTLALDSGSTSVDVTVTRR